MDYKKALEIIQNLPDSHFEKFWKKIKKEEYKKEQFLKSKRFQEILSMIKIWIDNNPNDFIQSDNYNDVIPGLSNKEFEYFFSSVLNNLNLECNEDDECDWENKYVIYEGLIFMVIYGQGSLYRILKK